MEDCLQPQEELIAIPSGSCGESGRRVCLFPLGQNSPSVVTGLIDYFAQEYGLSIVPMTPLPVPQEFIDRERMQIEAGSLIDYVARIYPELASDPQAVLIGLTAVDVYTADEDWRFAFGVRGTYGEPLGVISTFRMNLYSQQELADEELVFARVRKMVERYVGQLYYGLELNDDPKSPLYHTILGLTDLDRIEKQLPVAPARGS